MSVRTQFSANSLRTLRKAAGVNRDILAFAVGLTTGSIANYEQGRTVPSAEVLGQLADVLECAVSDFFEERASD